MHQGVIDRSLDRVFGAGGGEEVDIDTTNNPTRDGATSFPGLIIARILYFFDHDGSEVQVRYFPVRTSLILGRREKAVGVIPTLPQVTTLCSTCVDPGTAVIFLQGPKCHVYI